jgi:hypothetical protein
MKLLPLVHRASGLAVLLRLLFLLMVACTAWPSRAAEVPGVRAEYFNYTGSGTPSIPGTPAKVDRIESQVKFWRRDAAPATGIDVTHYLIRYTGYVRIPTTGSYLFGVIADDGVRLYLDCDESGDFQSNELLFDQWADQSFPAYYESTASCSNQLVAGHLYKFRYEYYQNDAYASAYLRWQGPSPLDEMAAIPSSDGTGGLVASLDDSTPPWLTSTSVRCATAEANLLFSEQVSEATAQTAANYTLSGGATISSATLMDDKQTVRLKLSSRPVGSQTLTVNHVTDLAGNTIAADSQVAMLFQASPSPLAGLVGTYYDQNGTAGAYFTGNTLTRLDSTIDFDWSGSPGGTIPGDQFSVRWKGLILVPTSGNYDFELVADNGVRLYVNESEIISRWLTVSDTYHATVAGLTAGTYVHVTLEFYEESGVGLSKLRWKPPGGSSYVTIPAGNLFHCADDLVTLSHFSITSSGSQSTCVPASVSITAIDISGNTYVDYTGSITIGTSTGRGDWSVGTSPSPAGTFVAGPSSSGSATYTFTAGDAGIVTLKLSETLAQDVVVSAADALVPESPSTSSALAFPDNAFTFTEDASSKIGLAYVAVAGRPHDFTASLIRKDPTTGSCGVATDYNGSRALKMWRTDNNGSWTAPSVSATSIPSSMPSSNNLSLSFTSGVASFMLDTTDIGRYNFTLRDDSLNYASSVVTGNTNNVTVRPFAIVVQGLAQNGAGNPGGSNDIDGVFGKAGVNFQATVGAYRWTSAMKSNGTDANDDGLADSGATLANVTAGDLTPSFSSTVTLSTLSGSQTPAGGTLGTLSGGSITGFVGGSVTTATLKYSEVGSFAFTSAVTSFLGSSLSLVPIYFNASGVQSTRVGRFTPASFNVGTISLTNRSDLAVCAYRSFTYLDENFQLKFTLTAVNGDGSRTRNYTGSFAKLDPSSAAAWNLGGVDGSTSFLSTGSSPRRLSLGTAAGSWGTGSAGGLATAVTLSAAASRSSAPDGPFTASFGIAPVDSDGVAMGAYDLDADSSVIGNDRKLLTTVPLKYGRLKLSNTVGPQGRVLNMPLTAEIWSSGSFATNTNDQCTAVPLASVNFGNHRKTLTAADTTLTNSSLQVQSGTAYLKLAAPSAGHSGTVDVALSLGSSSTTDTSCLQPWTPAAGKAATQGANLAYLRGGWCGSTYDKDPAARAAFGVYHGTDKIIYQRENH